MVKRGSKRLTDIIASIMPRHRNALAPVRARVASQLQANFEGMDGGETNRTSLGTFYEWMTAGFYGGTVRKLRYPNGNGNDYVVPDVIDRENSRIGEVKSCGPNRDLKLNDGQIAGYTQIQVYDPEQQIYFALYREPVSAIESFNESESNLYKQLAEETRFSVVLPLSLVHVLHGWSEGEDNELVKRYEGGAKWSPCTCVRTQVLNELLMEPEGVIEGLDLNPSDYRIKRYISPKVFSVARNPVKQFPIVYVSDRNHWKWVKDFIRKISGSLEEDILEGAHDIPF